MTAAESTAFETTIGLEVHVQLQLRAKLFAASPYATGGAPNSRVSVVELGLPGVLPVLNAGALRLAIRAGLALEGEIADRVHFDRKNYFYPDLPKGYQITQFDAPLCRGGRVPLGAGRFCQLERIHLEEDAGKTTHTAAGSFVDLNRAGAALIEIVGQPDLRTPADAHAFLTGLKQILQYTGVSECDMERGLLRCDANISLRPVAATQLGTKVEIKNLNSFKMVQRALEYEERRQRAVLGDGGHVRQETRLWNEAKGETTTMRTKEAADDYRFFQDPDLPPLAIDPAMVAAIREQMPELPAARRVRFAETFHLPDYDISVLMDDRRVADYFEAAATACGEAKLASNWVMTEVLRVLNEGTIPITAFPLGPDRLAALIRAQAAGRISRPAAKRLFAHLVTHDVGVDAAIDALGLAQISDPEALRPVLRAVVAAHPAALADYRAGREKARHALQGLVMRSTGSRANPEVVHRLLGELLRDAPESP